MEGGVVGDVSPPQSRSIWGYGGIKFLEAMPRIGDNNYFSEPCPPVERVVLAHRTVFYGFSEVRVDSGPFGTIRTIVNVGHHPVAEEAEKDPAGCFYSIDAKTKTAERRGSWWQAVAGIAFGGLVPMTTQRLADLVSWSVRGKLEEGEDMKAFRKLMKLALDAFSENTGQTDRSLLFGKRIVGRIILDDSGTDVDYTSEALGTDDDSIRSITTKLGWLMTLLEALVALVPVKNPNDLTRDVFEIGKQKRDDVFDACCGEIQRSYRAAVQGNVDECGIADLLQEPIEDLEKKKREISAKCCGTVARCIIMAWASLVRIVDWDSARAEGGETDGRRANMIEQPRSFQGEFTVSRHLGELDIRAVGVGVSEENVSGVASSADDQHERQRERKVKKMMTMEELPDIALWE